MYKYVNLIFIYFLILNMLTKSFVSTNICLKNKCSICLNKGCNCMLKCGHVFHIECIVKWIKTKKALICPNCRKKYF